MPEHLWVIYGLRLQNDDEYRYVGLTTFGASHRFKGHLKYARQNKNRPVYDWIRKHGERMIAIDVIEECNTDHFAALEFREQFWIATFRQQFLDGLKKKHLLNISDGGSVARGYKHSDEWKEQASQRFSGSGNPMFGVSLKVSDKTKEKHRQNMTGAGNHQYGKTGEQAACYGRTGELHPMFGKHHTDEAKAKISAATKGKPKSDATKEKMRQAQQRRVESGELSLTSKKAMHNRWHVNRDIVKDNCTFCAKATNDNNLE